MIKYGWLSKQDTLYSYLDYNRERREYTHRWSPKAMGEMFGFREYDKLITLEGFLKTPINVLEDILEGVASGTERIKKLHEGRKGNKVVDPADLISDELRKMK